jgi:putative resolvase
VKLSEWARQQGISYKTAWRWYSDGQMPVLTEKTPSGSIFVKNDIIENNLKETVIYCRVSNHSRKEELDYQVQRCEDFCRSNGWAIAKSYKEIASGLNDERKEFWRAIDSKPKRLVVENKDRLTRFGFNYLDRLLKERGTEIVVIHRDKEDETDLLKDMVSVLYSFCARLYGLRRAYSKTKKCEKILNSS